MKLALPKRGLGVKLAYLYNYTLSSLSDSSFLIGRKRSVNYRSHRRWRHLTADYNHVKDTQGHGYSFLV